MAKSRKSRAQKRNSNTNPMVGNTGGAIRRFPSPKVHTLLRSSTPSLLVSGPADIGYKFTPLLSDFPNSSDFTSGWEMYKIASLRVIFTCTTFNTASDLPFPRITVMPDYNDGTIPSLATANSFEEALQHTFSPTNPSFTVEINPAVANTIYRNGALSGYSALISPWLDTSYSDVPHFGVKAFVSDYNTTSTPTRRIYAQYQAVIQLKHAS